MVPTLRAPPGSSPFTEGIPCRNPKYTFPPFNQLFLLQIVSIHVVLLLLLVLPPFCCSHINYNCSPLPIFILNGCIYLVKVNSILGYFAYLPPHSLSNHRKCSGNGWRGLDAHAQSSLCAHKFILQCTHVGHSSGWPLVALISCVIQ